MARPFNILTAKSLTKLAKTKGRHSDGRSLHLYVKPNGSASWIFRYRDRLTGKLHDKGLGSYSTVTLAVARQLADKCREVLVDKKDPIEVTNDVKAAKKAAKANSLTFRQCFERFYQDKRLGWRNEKHAQQWVSTIETYCAGILNKQISAVDTDAVVEILKPIWLNKAETARRVRQRIEAVIDWAKANKLYLGENPARLKGHLDKLLASQPSAVKHREAVPYDEMADFMASLDSLDSLSASALKLQILTASRPSEATNAKWSEFDFTKALWTIPAERMKAKKVHVVPLSPQLVDILNSFPNKGDGYLFPSLKGKPITTAALLKLVKEQYKAKPAITGHGFRSTFRDWAGAVSTHPSDIAEAALAHVIKNKTEAAYARDKLIEKRRTMMTDWANYCYAKVANETENS